MTYTVKNQRKHRFPWGILLGLAALDQQANPVYDSNMAQQLQQRGMQVAAMTPEHLASWFAEVMQ